MNDQANTEAMPSASFTQAILFSEMMTYLWGTDESADKGTAQGMCTRALTMAVKTHRVNEENAFEVLQIAFPDCVVRFVECEAPAPESSEDERVRYQVTFSDKSRALVWAGDGIGNMVEPL
jgi:hypothetical protein